MSALKLRPLFAILLGVGMLSISTAALAQGNNGGGNNGGGNPCFPGGGPGSLSPVLGPTGLFDINASGTITVTGPKSVLVTKTGTSINNWILLGINQIGVVSLAGDPLANALGIGGSTVVPSNGGPTSWNPCGSSFYDANNQGFPNTNGSNWLRTASTATLNAYGLTVTDPTFGTFDFGGSGGIVGKTFGTDYLIAIDFIAGNPNGTNTTTARMFFGPTGGTNGGGNGQSGSSGNGGEVPEPGEWAAMGVLSAGLLGLMARKRRVA